MTAVVDIYNLALSHIYASRVMSPTEASKQASYCNTYYDVSRRQVLEDAPWSFATGRRTLSLLDAEYPGWDHVYQIPTGTVRIHEIASASLLSGTGQQWPLDFHTPTPRIVFDTVYHEGIGKVVIVSNIDDAVAHMTFDVKDPNAWPSHFTLALSYLLASNIAVALAGPKEGAAMQANCLALYQNHLAAAAAQDGAARVVADDLNDFERARG